MCNKNDKRLRLPMLESFIEALVTYYGDTFLYDTPAICNLHLKYKTTTRLGEVFPVQVPGFFVFTLIYLTQVVSGLMTFCWEGTVRKAVIKCIYICHFFSCLYCYNLKCMNSSVQRKTTITSNVNFHNS